LTFCAPVPLKLTVLGAEEVTSKMPAVMVSTLAMPSSALDDNCRDVPLRAALKRWAVPLKVEVPLKVTVPVEAVKLPFTERPEEIVKEALVVIEPVTDSVAKLMVPVPVIVLEAPLMVMLPAVAAKLPLTNKLPLRLNEVAVLTVPLIARLSSEMPRPLIVVPAPVIDKVPPDAWLNEPGPVVARFPVKVMLPAEKLTRDAATVR